MSVGDQVIDTFKVADREPVMRKVSIPAAQLGAGDMVEMKIDTGQSFVPAQTPVAKSGDQRELGVRVFHAFVEAEVSRGRGEERAGAPRARTRASRLGTWYLVSRIQSPRARGRGPRLPLRAPPWRRRISSS